MAMRAIGRNPHTSPCLSCSSSHCHPGICWGSLPLGWRWVEAGRGCELKGDASWRRPISSGPKIFTLSSRFTGHLFQDASLGLSRRKPGSLGAAMHVALVLLCLLSAPSLDLLLSCVFHVGMVVTGSPHSARHRALSTVVLRLLVLYVHSVCAYVCVSVCAWVRCIHVPCV